MSAMDFGCPLCDAAARHGCTQIAEWDTYDTRLDGFHGDRHYAALKAERDRLREIMTKVHALADDHSTDAEEACAEIVQLVAGELHDLAITVHRIAEDAPETYRQLPTDAHVEMLREMAEDRRVFLENALEMLKESEIVGTPWWDQAVDIASKGSDRL